MQGVRSQAIRTPAYTVVLFEYFEKYEARIRELAAIVVRYDIQPNG